MKAIVRDDIISLDSFVAAEFKYKKYLEILKVSGNYCFLDQFKKLVPKGQSIVNGMIKNNLIATENINKNYKYIYLTDAAMKYLYLKDSDEDFSEVTKNRISVKKISKNPTEKQLLASAYKFHLILGGDKLIAKESILKNLEDYIYIKSIKVNRERYLDWVKESEDQLKKHKDEFDKLINQFEKIKKIRMDLFKETDLLDINNKENELQLLKLQYRDIVTDINGEDKGKFKFKINELYQQKEILELKINFIESELLLKSKIKANYEKILLQIKHKKEKEISSYNDLNNKVSKIKKIVKELTIVELKPGEFTPGKLVKAQREFEKLYDISKIIARLNDKTLEFIILDTGNFKTAYGYLKKINKLNSLKLGYEKVNIIIYSYADHRAANLYNEFSKVKKDKEKSLETVETYNLKTKNNSNKLKFYLSAEKHYSNTPEFEVEVRDDFFYIGKYKSIVSSGDKSIKRKDKKAIDDLINKLNN